MTHDIIDFASATANRRRHGRDHEWRLSCILCARAFEVDVLPTRRRCTACGGYCEAKRTKHWDTGA